jgi:hypothetical protein
VGKASSNKKVQRAARAGGHTKVRSQQGLLFPIVLVAVLVVGIGLIVYARHASTSAARAATDTPPTLSDHWHAAYGLYACGKWLANIQNTNDEHPAGTAIGIHTHGDGVIHVHPFSASVTGKNAVTGRFFDNVGMKMTPTEMKLPEGLGDFKDGQDCDGKPGHVKAIVWPNAAGTDHTIYATDFDKIRFTNDRMAMTFAFVNDSEDLTKLKPASIPTLDKLSDVGTTTPTPTTTTIIGPTVPPQSTTTSVGVAGASATTAAGAATTAPSATTALPTGTTAASATTSGG